MMVDTARDITTLDSEGVQRLVRNFVKENISPTVLSDPGKSSAGAAILKMIAFATAEIASEHINWQVNESNLDTCSQLSSAERLARNNAYVVHTANAATVTLQFDGPSIFSVPKGFRCSASAGTNSPVVFSTTAAGTASNIGPGQWRLSLEAIQAEYKIESGLSNGVEDFEITLSQQPVIIDADFLNSGVVINGLTYQGITNRINAGPTDRVFTYYHNQEENLVLRFGDNVFGAMVPHNTIFTISYKVGGGFQGNVVTSAIQTLMDAAVGLNSVTNPAPATGGSDAETLNEIKANAENNVFVRRAAITATDYESIAIEVNGIGKAKAIKDIASGEPPTIDLYLASEGLTFGVPDVDTQTAVLQYFFDKQPLGVNLAVFPATEEQCRVRLDVALESGTNQNEAETAIKAAVVNLLNYPTTNFNTSLLAADILSAAQINGVQGPNLIENRIVPEIVEASTNVGDFTNPLGVIVRSNCEVAYNLISATGATTFAISKKIPRVASVLAVDSVKDLTIDYTQVLSTSTSITVKSATINSITDNTQAWITNQWTGFLVVDSSQNIYLVASNTTTKLTLGNNAINLGAGDHDVSAGAFRVVRSFRNKTIEKAGATRTILYNTQNQWFIDNIGEGDLTNIMAKDDRWFIEIPNGSGSVGTLCVSTDGDYAFTMVAGITPFRSTPPVDTWSFITSDFANDVIYKRDSDILTLASIDVVVNSFYRTEQA